MLEVAEGLSFSDVPIAAAPAGAAEGCSFFGAWSGLLLTSAASVDDVDGADVDGADMDTVVDVYEPATPFASACSCTATPLAATAEGLDAAAGDSVVTVTAVGFAAAGGAAAALAGVAGVCGGAALAGVAAACGAVVAGCPSRFLMAAWISNKISRSDVGSASSAACCQMLLASCCRSTVRVV